ncbi:MAG: DUF928 domain-containing protein [Cyanobacteria bacterium J06635_11]
MKAPRMIFSVLGTLPLLLILSQSQTLRSQTAHAQTTPLNTSLQFVPPPPPDRGRPGGRSEGGASRGSCTVDPANIPLTALVPSTQETPEDAPAYESVFTLTDAAKPTFWFYVPYEVGSTPLEFVLQDENNNTLYKDTFTSSGDGTGVVHVTLPSSAPDLQLDERYHWYFLAYCDSDSPTFVEGWTQRSALSPSVEAAVAAATPQEQAELYAQNGFWQEALTLVGEQYQQATNSSAAASGADWSTLLESVDLGHIAGQPLLECCGLPAEP